MIEVNRKFIVILIVFAVIALLAGGTLPYYIFYFLLFVFILGFFYILVQKYTVTVQVSVDKKVCEALDTVNCLTIVKSGIFVPAAFVLVKCESIKAGAEGYEGEFVNLTKEEDSWLRQEIKFYHRGIYDFGTVQIKASDIFHIITLNKIIDSKVKVKVYPKIYYINRLALGGKDIYQEILDIRSSNEDIFIIKDVRKYAQGDSLKKVHWKVSAKHGELFVKNSDNIRGEEFTVFLDMKSDNLLLDKEGYFEEKNVDLTVSLVKYMQERGIAVKIFLNCKNPTSLLVDSKEKFDLMMELFLEQKSDGEDSFSEFIYKNYYKLQRNIRLAIVTGVVDENLCSTVSKIKEYGYEASLFYCSEASNIKENINYLKNIGVDCFNTIDFICESEKECNYEHNQTGFEKDY